MKHIILCADDYGQTAAISQAIIELLAKKRLSATSCMTNTPYWLAQAAWLRPFIGSADLGLHFNLTHSLPLTSAVQRMPLKSVLLKAYLRRLQQKNIETELHAQMDQFVAGTGQLPDFIDGHQHIHQFPVIRDAIINVYQSRLNKQQNYIRSVASRGAWSRVTMGAYCKTMLVQLLGAATFKKRLFSAGIPCNSSFAGIYPFAHAQQYYQYFPYFLRQISDNGIIMCHPGYPDSPENDDIYFSRPVELRYFLSDLFLQACHAENVTIARFFTPRVG